MNILIFLFLMNVSIRDSKIRHSPNNTKNVVGDTSDNMVNDNVDAPTDNKMTNNNQGDIEMHSLKYVQNIKNQKNAGTNNDEMLKVSKMLDNLLIQFNYNNELRPWPASVGDHVTRVSVNIALTTLGPVHDDRQILVFTCYLRCSTNGLNM